MKKRRNRGPRPRHFIGPPEGQKPKAEAKPQPQPETEAAAPTIEETLVEMEQTIDEPAPPADPEPAPKPVPQGDISIRYAEPADVQNLHFFLCLMSKPVLLAPIDAQKSWNEIERICRSDKDFALIAEINGEMVGTLGIIAVDWWYSGWEFMTDRWFFTFPALANKGVGTALLAEAALIAAAVGRTLIINGKPIQKNKTAGGGIFFMAHKILHRSTEEEPVAAARPH